MRKAGKEVVNYNYCCGSMLFSRKQHFWSPDITYYLAMKRMYMC